jgi:phosphatidylglycerol:prolipoprotein diacylglycerol transferase
MIFLYFIYRKKKNIFGMTSAYFLLGYWVIRFSTEFVRLPDPQVGYLFGTSWMTLWQLLSLPMIVWGLFILTWIWKKEEKV